jgi:hypothetical protein
MSLTSEMAGFCDAAYVHRPVNQNARPRNSRQDRKMRKRRPVSRDLIQPAASPRGERVPMPFAFTRARAARKPSQLPFAFARRRAVEVVGWL